MNKQRWTDNNAPMWQQVLIGSIASVVLLTAFLGCLYWMAHKASDMLEAKQHTCQCITDRQCEEETT